MRPRSAPKLKDVVESTIIIAHNEETTDLRDALSREGFLCTEQRGGYTDLELGYPSHIRCLVNHARAWRVIADSKGYVLVAEADFVPVKGLADLPLPFVPHRQQKAMAWLYSVGPVIYHVDDAGGVYGHNAGTVAYVLDERVAIDLLSLYEQDMRRHVVQRYRDWEAYYPVKLRHEKGVRCYIPYKMYGEHGGFANPEHEEKGIRSWHEADCLAGALHFLPAYAKNRQWRFRLRRLRGRSRGIYRLVRGNYFDGWVKGWYESRENRLLRFWIALERFLPG